MIKAKRKKKTRAKSRSKSKPTKRPGIGDAYRWAALRTIARELADLTAGLDCLPELRLMAEVMRDVEHPPPTTATRDDLIGVSDEIGRTAIQHFGVALDEKLSASGLRFIDRTMNAGPVDLLNAIDSVAASVQWRLYRLEALIRLLEEEEAKARGI